MNNRTIFIYFIIIMLAYKQNTIQNLNDLNKWMDKNDPENTYIIYFEETELVNEIKNKLGNWIYYINVDRNIFKESKEFAFVSKNKNIKILLFPFGDAQKRYKMIKIFYNNSDLKDIIITLNEFYKEDIEVVTEKNMHNKIGPIVNSGKYPVILVIDNDKVLLSFKIASKQKKYKKYFRFLVYKKIDEKTQKIFKLYRVPNILVFYIDNKKELEKEETRNKEEPKLSIDSFNRSILFNNIDEYLINLEKTIIAENNKYPIRRVQEVEDLMNITSPTKFNDNCRDSEHCLIALFNMNENNKEKIEVLKEIQEIYEKKSLSVGYMDGICHDNVLEKIDITFDNLPRVIFIKNKSLEYYHSLGKFDKEDLLSSFNRVLRNKLQSYKIEFKFEEHDCKEKNKIYKKQIESAKKKTQLDDEITKEAIRQSQEREKEKLLKKEKKRRGSDL